MSVNYTYDKQVLWESAGAFFPRDNSLVSAHKSHSSGVRGLLIRCLLFNPEGSCSNPWVCANFFTSIPKQKVLTFSALWDSSLFRLCEKIRLFRLFRKYFNVLKGSSLQFVLIFCNRTNVKKSQRVPFRFYGTMRLLKNLIFCFFFENFSKTPICSPSFFLKFLNRMVVKESQRAPFYSFWHCEKFQNE